MFTMFILALTANLLAGLAVLRTEWRFLMFADRGGEIEILTARGLYSFQVGGGVIGIVAAALLPSFHEDATTALWFGLMLGGGSDCAATDLPNLHRQEGRSLGQGLVGFPAFYLACFRPSTGREATARSPEASRLVVTGDHEVTLRLESADDSDEVINIIPPRITSDLIDVRSETGIDITVKAE